MTPLLTGPIANIMNNMLPGRNMFETWRILSTSALLHFTFRARKLYISFGRDLELVMIPLSSRWEQDNAA